MDPLTAAAAIGAVSAIAQAYNAEQARGANKKRLNELKRAFDAIVPPEYDVSITDPPKYLEQALPQAKLDFSRLTPEDFKVVGQYSPKSAQFISEQRPELLKGSALQKEGRQAQVDALRQLQSAAKGQSPELAINLQRAQDQAQAQAQSRQQSITQDAARRGMSGSGLELAAQLQGTGDSMASGAAGSQNAALAAYREKMAAIQQSGQMGRQLSQDELSMEGANNDVINSFNQRTTRAYQDYENQRAAMQNQAQAKNLELQQSIADRNTQQKNDFDRFNLQNHNQLAQQSYDNTRGERNYADQIAQQKAQWAAAEKDRQNRLKSQSYGDQMNRMQSMQGITSMQNQQATQSAQDRNAAIGAIGNVGSGYYQGQAQRQAQDEAQRHEDARWDKYLTSRYPKKTAYNEDDDAIYG